MTSETSIKFNVLEFTPSFSWFVFMLVPFLTQIYYYKGTWVLDQLYMIVFILLVFIIADWFCAQNQFKADVQEYTELPNCGNYSFENIIIFTTLFIVIIHVIFIPRIPLLDMLTTEGSNTKSLAEARQLATKFSGAYWPLSYLYNLPGFVLLPIILCLYIRSRKYYTFIIVLFFSIIYLFITTAKFPALSMVFLSFFGLAFSDSKKQKKYIKTIIVVFFAYALLVLFSLYSNKDLLDNKSSYDYKYSYDDQRRYNTVADKYRIISPITESVEYAFANKIIYKFNTLVYRTWLVPSEVSLRWYQYYSNNINQLGIFSIFTQSGFNGAPSRIVGNWAYHDKYPEKYLKSVNAYSSFDADAYSRYGVVGVILATSAFVFIRIFIRFLRRPVIISQIIYGVGLSSLSIMIFQASFQAIFISNGIFFIIILLWVVNKWNFEHAKKV